MLNATDKQEQQSRKAVISRRWFVRSLAVTAAAIAAASLPKARAQDVVELLQCQHDNTKDCNGGTNICYDGNYCGTVNTCSTNVCRAANECSSGTSNTCNRSNNCAPNQCMSYNYCATYNQCHGNGHGDNTCSPVQGVNNCHDNTHG